MHYKLDFKLFALWMLLFAQVLLVIFYLLASPSSFEHTTSSPVSVINPHPIKFVAPYSNAIIKLSSKRPDSKFTNHINLKYERRKHFIMFNSTECFAQGTDLNYMKRFLDGENIKCSCKRSWHSKDCGQPEVIWRALIASRQKTFTRRRRKPRRIISIFMIANVEVTIAEIKINELQDVVDLFIIGETNCSATGDSKPLVFFEKLRAGSFKEIEHKILYIPLLYSVIHHNKSSNVSNESYLRELWVKGKQFIGNLKQDDLLLITDAFGIPSTKSLLFFKLYDGWPQPVAFRLRWSVYGYYWQHPKMTIMKPGIWSAQTIKDLYDDDITDLESYHERYGESGATFKVIVGDLNHYGGWYCNWCLEPSDIVTALQSTPDVASLVNWDQMARKIIDADYVEDLIGTGLWLDGKTALLHKSQYNDPYFAPQYIINNSWNYDFLMKNLYSKLDY